MFKRFIIFLLIRSKGTIFKVYLSLIDIAKLDFKRVSVVTILNCSQFAAVIREKVSRVWDCVYSRVRESGLSEWDEAGHGI